MQKLTSILILAFCLLPFVSTSALGSDVYIFKLQGNQLYRVSQLGSTVEKRELRIMEFIPENSVLEIGENTTAYLTCPDCEIVKLTAADSPFTVQNNTFKKKKSKSKVLISHFTAALKEFIHPDSKPGRRVYMNVRDLESFRTQDICDTLYPQDRENIMIMGDHISFKWGIKGDMFNFQLFNSSNDQLIKDVEIKDAFLEIPFDKLKPGFVYNWKVVEKKGNSTCQASFSVLSEQDTRKIKNNLSDIARILPENADQETRIRLQAGYLLSEGFIVNAFTLLQVNGF